MIIIINKVKLKLCHNPKLQKFGPNVISHQIKQDCPNSLELWDYYISGNNDGIVS